MIMAKSSRGSDAPDPRSPACVPHDGGAFACPWEMVGVLYGILWVAWILLFLAIEIPAAVLNPDDSAEHPHTLSAWVWRLIEGKGRWHYAARFGVIVLLVWLLIHMVSGGRVL